MSKTCKSIYIVTDITWMFPQEEHFGDSLVNATEF